MAEKPKLGRTRLVLIDGPSGAGKTTLAYALAGTIPAEIVHTDDLLDGWAGQFTYWARLESQILQPIASGEAGYYQAYNWVEARFDEEWIKVPVPEVLIVEGVGAGREQGRDRASLVIFVSEPLAVREARSLARDGIEMQEHLRSWRRREELHFGADATAWCAGLVIGSGT
ncbi:uridine kinase family protein [Rhizocola hellebori]|nr:hypothetical protein [Rhizocola hellebori]